MQKNLQMLVNIITGSAHACILKEPEICDFDEINCDQHINDMTEVNVQKKKKFLGIVYL